MFINNDFELLVIIITEFVHFFMCGMTLNIKVNVLLILCV